MTSYRFGFLDKQVTYRFTGGEIAPVPEFDAAANWVALYRNKDGFLYPPTGRYQDKEGKPLPNTERPAHLFHLPVSHELRLDRDPPLTDRHRAHASFIIHLVAYLHGTCVQFEDWWFDARVPLGEHHNIHVCPATAEHFLSHAYQRWQTWPVPTQKQLYQPPVHAQPRPIIRVGLGAFCNRIYGLGRMLQDCRRISPCADVLDEESKKTKGKVQAR